MTARAMVAVALVVACGSRATPVVPTETPIATPPAASTAAPIAPTRATYHPLPTGWTAYDALDIAENVKLVVGVSGERWLVTTVAAPTDADPDATRVELAGATSFASEDLVAVRRRPSGYLFVGASGTTYFAANPLDDFTARRTPPERLRAAAAGKQAIVGITVKDTLVRSLDDGATWTPIAMPRSPAIPISVGASRAGEGLMIAAPGRLWASLDDLATWTPIVTEGLGPTEVLASVDDKMWVRGIAPGFRNTRTGLATMGNAHAMLKRAADGSPALDVAKRHPLRALREGDEDLTGADAVDRGEAVWAGTRYLELKPSADEANVPHAVVVQAGSVEHRGKITAAADCGITAVAADGNLVEVECVRELDGRKQAVFLRSHDFGATFALDGELAWGDQLFHRVWVSAKGSVIADSTCLSPEPSCGEDGLVVRPRGSPTFAVAAMPERGIHVYRVRMSSDGKRVYAAAYADVTGRVVLLVSKDAGRSFAMKPVPEVDGQYFTDAVELALDEATNTIVMIVERDPGYRFATRDDGETWDTKQLPFVADGISIAGTRGLATTGRGVAWETLDGGATWTEVAIPRAWPRGSSLDVACSDKACILGDVAIRDGWEIATPRDVSPVAAPAAKPPVHRPLLECTADGPEDDLGVMSPVTLEPTPAFAWFTGAEARTGAVDVISVAHGAKTISRVALLPPPTATSGTRRDVSPEGVVAVRAPRTGGASVDVEVAWWVASTGKVHRATLRDASPPIPSTGTPGGFTAIVPGYGLYVHLPNGPLRLVRETGAVSEIPPPPQFPSFASASARRIGKRTVFFGKPIGSYGDQPLAIADMPDTGTFNAFAWNLWPWAAGRARPATAGIAGDRLIVAWPGSDEVAPRAWSLALKDASAEPPEPVVLPTAKDDLATCAKGAAGSRVALPWVAGSRTPVVVKLGPRTVYQATENVVARVGASACTVGLEAGPPSFARATEITLVSAADLRGFAFMTSRRTEVVVPVACAPKPGPLPAGYATARGM